MSPSPIHSSCDPCRTRKLKCSGEPTGCTRCRTSGHHCHYSARKPMGRPLKRQRSSEAPGTRADGGLTPDATNRRADSHHPPAEPSGPPPPQAAYVQGLSRGLNNQFEALFPDLDLALDASATPDWQMNQPTQPWLMPSPPRHQQPFAAHDPSTQPVSPYLAFPDTSQRSCACLATLTSSMATLSQLPVSFPASLLPLRSAILAAQAAIACPECPQDFSLGYQNTMLLGTLLPLIAEGYGRVLRGVNDEARDKETRGERVMIKMGEMSGIDATDLPSWSERSDRKASPVTDDGIEVDISPEEWRQLARRVVRTDIMGPLPSRLPTTPSPSHSLKASPPGTATPVPPSTHASTMIRRPLLEAVNQMETRQRDRHHHDVLDADIRNLTHVPSRGPSCAEEAAAEEAYATGGGHGLGGGGGAGYNHHHPPAFAVQQQQQQQQQPPPLCLQIVSCVRGHLEGVGLGHGIM
ncbi:MAG: hypothetical protein M1817_006834 [Caeruleum heppii]|nr:MAG: hypothetical protein M1817_006834 [Caeruleum heppii]